MARVLHRSASTEAGAGWPSSPPSALTILGPIFKRLPVRVRGGGLALNGYAGRVEERTWM